MGNTLATWEARVQSLLGSPPVAALSLADIDQLVYAAVRKYSLDRPRFTFTDFTGDGQSFQLAIPSGWVSPFSWVDSVEYPQGERPPVFLDVKEVTLYPNSDAPTVIQLDWTTPAAGKKARIFYAVPYPLPDSNAATDLIPATSYEFVAKLAASGGAMELSARAAPNLNPTFPSATMGNAEGEEKRWLDLAAGYRKEYDDHVGTTGPGPASAVVDWDAASDWVSTGGRWIWRWPRR